MDKTIKTIAATLLLAMTLTGCAGKAEAVRACHIKTESEARAHLDQYKHLTGKQAWITSLELAEGALRTRVANPTARQIQGVQIDMDMGMRLARDSFPEAAPYIRQQQDGIFIMHIAAYEYTSIILEKHRKRIGECY